MLARIIEWSVRNVFLALLSTFFLVAAGIHAAIHTPLDAIPDLSDVQVILYTEYPGQAPQVVEDQVTYPLSTAMLAVPRSKVVRGFSAFGASFVYVIFEDGTDIYWARSRVLEYLNFAAGRLPQNVRPSLGPDATGVGWVYQYVVVGAQRSLAELRSIQDWFVRYQLTTAQGIAEVASVGGFVKTYQVTVDPRKLQAYGIPLAKLTDVIRSSNRDVGGRVVEVAETEFVVRGRGYLRGIADIGSLVVKAENGVPVLVKDVARIELGPDERRGITELNGEGEVVAGIAVARYGKNALAVIGNLKAKINEIASGSASRGLSAASLRPFRPDLPGSQEPAPYAHRRECHRGAGVQRISAPCAQRTGGHPHAAHRGAHSHNRDAADGAHLKHHEPGWHRDCHWRHGRCRHRDD